MRSHWCRKKPEHVSAAHWIDIHDRLVEIGKLTDRQIRAVAGTWFGDRRLGGVKSFRERRAMLQACPACLADPRAARALLREL